MAGRLLLLLLAQPCGPHLHIESFTTNLARDGAATGSAE
jgi:hypothetical protein